MQFSGARTHPPIPPAEVGFGTEHKHKSNNFVNYNEILGNDRENLQGFQQILSAVPFAVNHDVVLLTP